MYTYCDYDGPPGKIRAVLETSLPSVLSPSVLMEDVEDLIRQQTSNGTVTPRASSSYYENYHSLNEVSHSISLQSYYFHLTSIPWEIIKVS